MSASAEASTRRVSSQKRKRRQTVKSSLDGESNEVTAEAVPVELKEDAAGIAEVSQSEGPVMVGVNDAWSGVHPVGNQDLSWWEYKRRFPPPPFMLSHPTQLSPSMQPLTLLTQLTQLSTQPTQPLTQPTQPSTQPTQPLTQPTQPSTWFTQPLTQPTQPAQPTQPSTQPSQPSQPSTQPTQPSTQPTQPLTQPTQPTQPSTRFSQPLTQPTQPLTQPTQPTLRRQNKGEGKQNFDLLKQGKEEVQEQGRGPSVCAAGDTFYINIKIGKRRCAALLDTGSDVTLLPRHLADLSQIQRSTRKLSAANGSKITLIGEWHTTVMIGPIRVSMNFVVSDQVDEVLIGLDWMREHQCLLSFVDFTITLQEYRFPLLKRQGEEFATESSCKKRSWSLPILRWWSEVKWRMQIYVGDFRKPGFPKVRSFVRESRPHVVC